ncbi:MAG: hypothetical protein C0434_07915 [Xanthomonadaceae bacterium]|nr:hypothetical protein [Xanthomonadaceae bacterium]
MVTKAAQALAKKHAEVCGVDYDDLWKLESQGFIEDAEMMLDAVGAPDLLEALEDLCNSLGECGATEKGRAAIAKAVRP